MISTDANNVRSRGRWIKILLFPLVLLLLSAVPAQAQSVGGCVANFGGVIDGLVNPVPPSQITLRAISVDIDLRGGNRVDKAIYHATEIGDTTANGLRPCRDGAQQQQAEGEQQDSDPAAALPHIVRVTRSHLRPRPTRQSPPGLDSGGPAVVGPPWPVRPVTLRRHLSVALPLSKSRRIQLIRFAASPNLLAFAPFRFGRRLHAAGRKSIGYTIVTTGTPSFAPKLIVLTRLTTCVARSGASMSVDCSAHIDTLPSGSIVRRRTIWPFRAGLLRSSRLYNR